MQLPICDGTWTLWSAKETDRLESHGQFWCHISRNVFHLYKTMHRCICLLKLCWNAVYWDENFTWSWTSVAPLVRNSHVCYFFKCIVMSFFLMIIGVGHSRATHCLAIVTMLHFPPQIHFMCVFIFLCFLDIQVAYK